MDSILGRIRKRFPEGVPVSVHVGLKLTCLLGIFVGTMLETPFLETVSPWVSTLDKRSTETRG